MFKIVIAIIGAYIVGWSKDFLQEQLDTIQNKFVELFRANTDSSDDDIHLQSYQINNVIDYQMDDLSAIGQSSVNKVIAVAFKQMKFITFKVPHSLWTSMSPKFVAQVPGYSAIQDSLAQI